MSDESPNILEFRIMQALLDIIHETHVGLPREDRSRLELVEIRPKSSDFAKIPLSCSIAPNDPADPDRWLDEEMTYPGNMFNGGMTQEKYAELGGGQMFNLRYTIDFNFFFLDLGGIDKTQALILAQQIFTRIHRAISDAGNDPGGKFAALRRQDDYGHHLVRAFNAVKRRRLRPGGSNKKVLYKGKMWLQFETYYESA